MLKEIVNLLSLPSPKSHFAQLYLSFKLAKFSGVSASGACLLGYLAKNGGCAPFQLRHQGLLGVQLFQTTKNAPNHIFPSSGRHYIYLKYCSCCSLTTPRFRFTPITPRRDTTTTKTQEKRAYHSESARLELTWDVEAFCRYHLKDDYEDRQRIKEDRAVRWRGKPNCALMQLRAGFRLT